MILKCSAGTHQYSSPPVMHFSYTGPSSSRWLGKMTSLWLMMVLMTSLTWAWHTTGSCPSGMGIRVGPKQIAKLYESIMFSSLYWERLKNRTGKHCVLVFLWFIHYFSAIWDSGGKFRPNLSNLHLTWWRCVQTDASSVQKTRGTNECVLPPCWSTSVWHLNSSSACSAATC